MAFATHESVHKTESRHCLGSNGRWFVSFALLHAPAILLTQCFSKTSVAAVSVIRLIVVVEVNNTDDLTFKLADLVLWR